MSKRQVQIIILCEDRQQETLLRRYLDQLGFDIRKVRVKRGLSGRGSGAQYVQTQYPIEVRACRVRRSPNVGLLVAIDADTLAVIERQQRLAATLKEQGLEPRIADERIALLVPRRNVETWIHYLLGNEVDESTDYKIKYKGVPERDHCTPAAKELLRLKQLRHEGTPLSQKCPPSLVIGIEELGRID